MYYLRKPYYEINKFSSIFKHYTNSSEKNISNFDKITFLLDLYGRTTCDTTKQIIEHMLNNPSTIEKICFVNSERYRRHVFEISEEDKKIKLWYLTDPSQYSTPSLTSSSYPHETLKYASYILTYSKKIFIKSDKNITPR